MFFAHSLHAVIDFIQDSMAMGEKYSTCSFIVHLWNAELTGRYHRERQFLFGTDEFLKVQSSALPEDNGNCRPYEIRQEIKWVPLTQGDKGLVKFIGNPEYGCRHDGEREGMPCTYRSGRVLKCSIA